MYSNVDTEGDGSIGIDPRVDLGRVEQLKQREDAGSCRGEAEIGRAARAGPLISPSGLGLISAARRTAFARQTVIAVATGGAVRSWFTSSLKEANLAPGISIGFSLELTVPTTDRGCPGRGHRGAAGNPGNQ
jgi:hypothetical protein